MISISLVINDLDKLPSYMTAIRCVISINSSISWDKTIIEVPFLARLISDCRIEYSAPASIPHVGWEIINNLGLDEISLPITNFCKFPPDKLEALASDPGVTTLKLLITSLA